VITENVANQPAAGEDSEEGRATATQEQEARPQQVQTAEEEGEGTQ